MIALPSAKKCIGFFFVIVFLAHILLEDSSDHPVSDAARDCVRNEFQADGLGISLLQESAQVVARGAKEEGVGESALPQAGAECDVTRGLHAQPEDAELDQGAFMERLARPYRLRTVGIAVIGFGLLTLDSSSAVLLAF
mmetsp:Transcript_116900/g.342328  ORF Transcript_116900/g.342328 Transcript_116900/m.342328 type:complete len:139 (-) Transcript_116900:116-532(-)